uniref:ShKT domain-containing protein n=1 Tax=Panagrellus redivivus TaxID=6233 RepID=A0A7E5A001_PANRE
MQFVSVIVIAFAALVTLSNAQYNSCNYCGGYGYGGYRGGYGGYGGYGSYGYGGYASPLLSPYGGSTLGLNRGIGLGNSMCYDRSPNCAYMVSMGECATNPLATQSMCPISCGTGCTYGTAGLGYGTMDALADNSLLYSGLGGLGVGGLSGLNSLTYPGILKSKKQATNEKIISRPVEAAAKE